MFLDTRGEVVGNSNIFWRIFTPTYLGFHDPIWRSYVSNGLVKNHQLGEFEVGLVLSFTSYTMPHMEKTFQESMSDSQMLSPVMCKQTPVMLR